MLTSVWLTYLWTKYFSSNNRQSCLIFWKAAKHGVQRFYIGSAYVRCLILGKLSDIFWLEFSHLYNGKSVRYVWEVTLEKNISFKGGKFIHLKKVTYLSFMTKKNWSGIKNQEFKLVMLASCVTLGKSLSWLMGSDYF